jgi:hypothetical protein
MLIGFEENITLGIKKKLKEKSYRDLFSINQDWKFNKIACKTYRTVTEITRESLQIKNEHLKK